MQQADAEDEFYGSDDSEGQTGPPARRRRSAGGYAAASAEELKMVLVVVRCARLVAGHTLGTRNTNSLGC